MREQPLPERYFAARRPLGDPLRGRGWLQIEILPMDVPRLLSATRLVGAVTRLARKAAVAAGSVRATARWSPERAS